MNKFYNKNETLFTILLITIYLISNSLCINNYGLTSYQIVICNLILSLIIILFIIKNKLSKYYGLTKIKEPKKFLYFIPLIIIISMNLWTGININNHYIEIIFFIINMIFVGFLEEIIFRGFLFKMMEKENINKALIISSLTFGIGHILNLLNGAHLIPTLIQICYSTSIGYLFAIIFQKGKSLLPCIITHSLVNALSIFNIENNVTTYITPIFLLLITISYSIYINKHL